MQQADSATLKARLVELADVYGIRPPTAPAIVVWFSTLREFPIQDVAGYLIEWPKRHNKMPTPADCWRDLNERRTDEIEKKAAEEKAADKRAIERMKATPYGRSMLEHAKRIASNKPKSSEAPYRQAVRRMWAQEDTGKALLPIQLDYIRRSKMTRENDANEEFDQLSRDVIFRLTHELEEWPGIQRQPGED